MRPAPYDLVSSGTLVLNLENVWGIRHTWKDGKTQRLEDVLNVVVVGLIEAALQKKAQREEQERERFRQQELEWGARLPSSAHGRSGPRCVGLSGCGRRPANTDIFANSRPNCTK
jgi:hypothetical protein